MISTELAQFINENIELIDGNKFQELYNKLNDILLIPEFSKVLLDSNIDPLPHLNYIPEYCFYNMEFNNSFIIPDNISKIETNAFSRCILQDIYIPQSVKIIKGLAFSYCKVKTLDIPDKCSCGSFCFKGSTVENVTIGSNAEFNEFAFKNCDRLKTVKFKSSATVYHSMFEGCTSLESVDLGNIVGISDKAFHLCKSLEKVSIPLSCMFIGLEAFKNCYGLMEITIPGMDTRVSKSAFYGCPSSLVIRCTKDSFVDQTFRADTEVQLQYL